MARKSKHRVAETAEQYSDYALLVAGMVGFASVVGAIGAITLLPDYGSSGLFSLADQFFSVDGHSITYGAALAFLSAVGAYGTNQAVDSLVEAQEAWKETEAAAFLGAAGLPLAHELFTGVSDLTAGSPTMQLVFLGGYGYALAVVVDL